MSATHYWNWEKTLANILIAAVQNRFVTSLSLADTCQSLNDSQTKLLSLNFRINSNVLDMPNAAEASQKLVLNKHTADSNNLVCGLVNDDKGEICARCSTEQVKARLVRGKTRVGNNGEDWEDWKVRTAVICSGQWTNLLSFVWDNVSFQGGRTCKSWWSSRLTWTGIMSGWNSKSSAWSGVHWGHSCKDEETGKEDMFRYGSKGKVRKNWLRGGGWRW